MNKQYLKEH